MLDFRISKEKFMTFEWFKQTSLVSERKGFLYVNPGSDGPRRFKLPIAVSEVIVSGRSVPARIVELKDSNKA